MARTTSPPRTAEPFLPAKPTLPALREAAAGCMGCNLYQLGTQTVFGEGSADATVVFVGEQPGDQEDRIGRPFVGPAGRLLDEALENVGIDRTKVYVTNAVKHFKWTPKGKRRIHSKPDLVEVTACRPWLAAELAAVSPKVVVCLGATAAQSLLGKDFRVTKRRGEFLPWPPPPEAPIAEITATVHPSSIPARSRRATVCGRRPRQMAGGKGQGMSTGARFLIGVVVALALIGVISLLGSLNGFWKLFIGLVVAVAVAAVLRIAYPEQNG